MPTMYDLKPRFQRALARPAEALAAAGVTPNQLTVAAVVLSVAFGTALAASPGNRGALLALPGVLLFRMALNALDGMLARGYGMRSKSGVLMNELGDTISDAALYLPFALIAGVNSVLVVAVVALAGVSELAGALGPSIGASRRHDGPMGKSDRALAFGAIGLALGAGVLPGAWIDAALGAVALLSLVTVLNRVRGALKEVA